MHRLVLFWVFLVFLAPCFGAPPDSAQGGASRVVEALNTTLIEVMKSAQALGYQGRYKRLEPVVKRTHDLPFLARFSIGPKWKELTPDQKARWIDTFSKYSIATYAARFDGYSGERFKLVSEAPSRRGRMLVTSLLVLPDEDDIEFQYILARDDSGQWRIINVLVNGVSDLALKRAEYSGILASDGFDALLDQLSQKISDYAAGKSG